MASTTATVLFTDLVDSTRLSVAHGAVYDDARRAHDALLRSAVEAHHGRIIKGLGDGVMATFTAGVDAVAAARAAQQSIHRFNRRGAELSLSIRVGVAVGDVSFEGDDCFGEAVIEAARLCAVAEGDQILASETVQMISGGRRAPGFVSVGAIELKGLPHPVDVVEVEWERLVRSSIPLPARLEAEVPAFVGRTAELFTLHHAYDEVREQAHRQVVLVGGEPGLGKTALVSEAVRVWHSAGATVAMGWCEAEVRAPYRPFIDALAQLVDTAPPELLHAHVQRHGAGLLPLAPGLTRRIDPLPSLISSDPETERFLLFAAVADFLAALGEQAPVVLFLDDLHWADAGTASLIRSLATMPDRARLLIVGTFRLEELLAEHPMGQVLAAFHRVPNVTRLHLDGLDPADVLELVQRWAGADAGSGAARLAEDLVAETGGNAFFVTEVIRYLEHSGRLDALAAASAGDPSLMPDSVREVLGERVARLGVVADEVLAVAAVVGSEFELNVVAAVSGVPEDKALSILAEAATAALVRELRDGPGRFVFTHALVQHAVLVNLGPTREAAVHRRVAEFLESDAQTNAPVAALAHHWLRATKSVDSSRALDWAVQAGNAALEALAPGDAVNHLRQAIVLHEQLGTGDVGTRIDLLTKLGHAERLAGDPEHRDTLLKACRLAQRADDGSRLASAALENNGGSFSTFMGVDAERVAMLEAAIAVNGDEGRRALLLATLAIELTYSGDFDRRRGLIEAALDVARAHGDTSVLLRVMNLAFHTLWIPDTLAERLAITQESMMLVGAVEDPLPRYWSAVTNYHNVVQSGRVSQGEPLLRTATELAERLGQPSLQRQTSHIGAARHLLVGDPDAAEPLVRRAFEYGQREGSGEALVYFRSQEMCLHWERGTMTELSQHIKGSPPKSPNAAALRGLIFLESGRDAEANRLLDTAVDSQLVDLERDPAYITTLALIAEVAAALDHQAAAALVFDLLLPYGDQIGFDGVVTVGILDHYLGGLDRVLGRPTDAIDRLERSAQSHRGIPSPFFEARSLYELARSLVARGDEGDVAAAIAAVARSVEIASLHSYRMVHRRGQELLVNLNGA